MRSNRQQSQRLGRRSWRYRVRPSPRPHLRRVGKIQNPRRRQIDRRQLQEETSEDCCVCYEVLVPPMVHLGSCPHRLHLPCYAALRVGAGTDLRCPACRATVTVGEADRSVSRQHSDEVMEETLAVAQHEMPAEGGRGVSTRTKRGERGERCICSICHALVEENDRVQVSCSCDVHRRCA